MDQCAAAGWLESEARSEANRVVRTHFFSGAEQVAVAAQVGQISRE